MKRQSCPRPVVLLSVTLLLVFSACTSKPKSRVEPTKLSDQPAAASDMSEHYFDGGTYCVQTFLQGPATAQPLHFSNKVTESDQTQKSKDFEADLSGDTLDIVHHDHWLATEEDKKLFEESRKYDDPRVVTRDIHDGFADETITNHISRSDEVGWRGGVISIAQGGTPWGLFISKPPVSRVGTENINGYETTKYSVDTTHQTQGDKFALLMSSGMQDYNITGIAWVLKNPSCVLQYDLEFDQTGKDGKVSKTHFAGTITKKEVDQSPASPSKAAS